MKRFVAVCLSLGLLAGVAMAAPTVDSIVKDHFKAIGGKESYGKVSSLKRSGTVKLSGMFGEFSGTFEEVMVPKKKSYSNMDLGVFLETSGYNGTVGWKNNNMEGMKDITGEELVDLQSRSSIDSIVDLFEKDGAAAFKLVEDAGDAEHDVLSIPRNDIRFFINKKTGLLGSLTAKYTDPQMGDTTMKVTFGEYEAFSGVQLPKSRKVVIGADQLILEFVFDKTELNAAVEDSLFEKPAA